ncbi:hypothetical protein [Streptomyces purpureus]|uniref:Membrane protein n=1 Tax=Streptomyces purpureus TaxID=1951 RepID=A0A918H094_9ACTN|nr:hypothetical protein [Streptomyces purpureus]GGT21566.1 membrane protein [Streptomyces purpureus]
MHMNVAPHLLTEDRAEFERILDDALRNAHDRPDLAAVGERLNTEQLRTMALNATTLITSSAAAEYDHFVKVREELRAPSGGSALDSARTSSGGESVDGTGAGLGAVVTVLAPVLAGTAALIFLLVGYLLKALDEPPAFADTLLATGWFFGAVTAVGILAAAVGLLVTALRNGATQVPAQEPGGEPDEVSRAREAWRIALLERGIVPFLRAALADPSADPGSSAPPRPMSRIPKVGFSGPDFSSPSEGATGTRPMFTSPDFTSPDFGGPEHQPE